MTPDQMITSFTLGLLATGSPCVLPLYPGFLAYLANRAGVTHPRTRYFLGVFVLAGVLTMMLALGALISLLSISIGRALSIVIPIADLLIVGLGILLIANLNPFKMVPQITVPAFSHPFVNAFIYGLLYGPIALPCSGPLIVSIFAISLSAGEIVGRLSVFFWFGLGFGVPLLILSLLAGTTQRWITRQFAIHSRTVNLAGGILLVGIGIYDFIQNWELIAAFF